MRDGVGRGSCKRDVGVMRAVKMAGRPYSVLIAGIVRATDAGWYWAGVCKREDGVMRA